MQISEIRVKLVENRSDRLKAFCSVTFDNMFVVRDLKIIEGAGGYFVAMPSRKLADRCQKCGAKNHLRSRFCNDCGARLNENRGSGGHRPKLHADVAHPVNTQAREYIQSAVVEAYEKELERSQQPGYVPTQLGDDYDDEDMDHVSTPAPVREDSATTIPSSAGVHVENKSSADSIRAPKPGEFQKGIFER
ncbi:MAG: SpoVG family protein [Sedimentisphaerales bacterium]|nr:SpoVG family protein [Sedimentisphaerales bacterium]